MRKLTTEFKCTTVTTSLADDGGVWVDTLIQLPNVQSIHVSAVPQHTDEDRARATSLGYASVDDMTREHDLLHTMLAAAQSYNASLALTLAETGSQSPYTRERVAREEALVLFVQRLLNHVRAAPSLLLDEHPLEQGGYTDITA